MENLTGGTPPVRYLLCVVPCKLHFIGIVKILMVYFKFEQGKKIITALSVGLSIIAVLFLAMAREPYAITVMFLLLFIKGGLLYKQAKAGQ